MKRPLLIIFLAIYLSIAILATLIYLFSKTTNTNPVEVEPIILTDTDTIYKEIKELKIKSDTIKVFYEKKVKDYRIMPTTERVRLFTERINR